MIFVIGAIVILLVLFLWQWHISQKDAASEVGTAEQTAPSAVPQDDILKDISIDLYSMDFAGAEKLIVREIDHAQENKPERRKEIVDPQTVEKVVALLAELPKQGQIMKKMAPSIETTVYAEKEGSIFAFVRFYRSNLKTEDTSFYHTDEPKEQELFSLIKF